MTDITSDRHAWERARLQLLELEKAHLAAGDELAARRRALPKLRIDRQYVFEGDAGRLSIADLFEGRSQLIVQHFMLGPEATAGCPMCSFWADGYDPLIVHLNQRDVSFAAVSRAPVPAIEAYRQRMGWTFRWVSSGGSTFNEDFGVSPDAAQLAAGRWRYNYADIPLRSPDLPGISVFERDSDGTVLHTYSTFGRGLDPMNGAYAYLDLTAKGRDEQGLPFPMAWVRRHDEY